MKTTTKHLNLMASLHGLWRWLLPASTSSTPMRPVLASHCGPVGFKLAQPFGACSTRSTLGSTKTLSARPLRVVRILDEGGRPGHIGRLVISGRMADVCAELDRLAAHELTLQ